MSQFPKKQFQGKLYEFQHLAPTVLTVALDSAAKSVASLHVAYSIHCFTEEFDTSVHQEHHRYSYADETRAFDVVRYDCSVNLPAIIAGMSRATVYRALQNNYTYVAQIPVNGIQNLYSLFFTLKNEGDLATPSARMYVQSAYPKPLTVGANAKNWRFGSLLGQVTGVFTAPVKKQKPKKKAP